ncbi:MAG: flagellar filament capping protein FliD [Candidatus Didemnitutus sp.]|nr:flagellar filament capping protein FliD [Candidatus Didemnitutus sp.]
MAGIKISNLLQNSAFDWQEIVTKLMDVQRTATIKPVEAEIAANTDKTTALNDLNTLMESLKSSVQAIRTDNVFSLRSVSSSTNTTWTSTSSNGAAVGSYTFDVTQLATQARLAGADNIGSSLAATNDVTGLTVANLRTATAVTAGTFTVNGKQVTVATTDSLDDVFNAISTATGGTVTASYDSSTDKVTLSGSSTVVLGAANDTSNFFSVFKLANNGASSVSSSGKLGTVKTTASLASAGLATTPSGSGTFSINGVSIAYDTATDTIKSLISRINKSTAGVTASYDSANDRMMLSNNSTGDIGIGVTDDSNGILAALGLTSGTGATLTRGTNALFTVNGGETLSSTSNTLTDSVHGISGLSVTVNTKDEQTLTIGSDVATMQSYITKFVDAFNAVQSKIDEDTKITITGTKVATSVLTGNREVEGWGTNLRDLVFSSISGLSGTIDQLDDLGIDFDGISNQLKIADSEKLATALTDKPDDVGAYFLTSGTGFVSKLYTNLTKLTSANRAQQSRLSDSNDKLNTQLERLQAQLASEEDRLTQSFIQMQNAQSNAQTQASALDNAFGNKSSSN